MTDEEFAAKVRETALDMHNVRHAIAKSLETAERLSENLIEMQAFRRGAEAMRHALLQRVDWHGSTADRIRAEPVPEDDDR